MKLSEPIKLVDPHIEHSYAYQDESVEKKTALPWFESPIEVTAPNEVSAPESQLQLTDEVSCIITKYRVIADSTFAKGGELLQESYMSHKRVGHFCHLF